MPTPKVDATILRCYSTEFHFAVPINVENHLVILVYALAAHNRF